MNDQDEQPREDRDIVDRAVDALRAEPIADGPPPRLSAATVELLRAARSNRPQMGLLRIAALLLIASCLAGVIALGVRERHRLQARGNERPAPAAPAPGSRLPRLANTDAPTHTLVFSTDTQPRVRPVLATLGSAVAVTGHVYFRGDIPPHPARMDPSGSLGEYDHPHDQSIVVNDDGTLQNVVVSISGGLRAGEPFPLPPGPVVLNQHNCTFVPHVVAAMTGQEVIVRNLDPMLHSVHAMDAEETPAFNFAQPADGQRMIAPFQSVKTFKVKCDIHPWMTAWVRVFNHPYFDVTHDDGTFAIKDLPPGTYTIKAWHEVFGVQEKQITVTGGEPAVIDFTFDPRQ